MILINKRDQITHVSPDPWKINLNQKIIFLYISLLLFHYTVNIIVT